VASTLESLLVLLAAVIIATFTMMIVARMMLGSRTAESHLSAGRYLFCAAITIGLLFIISLINWPSGFGSLGTVLVLVALMYTFKLVLLPDTTESEQWPRSVWMAVITFVIFLGVNAAAQAIFHVEPFSL
jgi:hypothetical protein